jgi:Zn-dependent peptidase ImmA (M78 family)
MKTAAGSRKPVAGSRKPTAGSRKPIAAAAGVTLAVLVVASAVAQDDGVQRMAREIAPQVERAVGLRFKRPPVVALRSRDQVRAYLNHRMDQELPPRELAGIQRAYRAFGLVPDTLDLRRLMLDLYGEQVVGFYDPDSTVLYVVRGAEPMMVRLILAHELVHALQDQYTSLNAILKLRRQNDRQMAGQAVAEGQATLASLQALAPGMELRNLSAMWQQTRRSIRSQQEAMPVFAAAPRLVQEDLIFPYLAGADFVRAFEERRAGADETPYGDRMPVSTEQVLHESKYTARERPARVRLAVPPGDTLVYDDDFGEFDTRTALESWGTSEADAVVAASGWNGDRFEALGTRSGTALIWVTAWDTADDAGEFERALRADWRGRSGAAEGAYTARGIPRRWQVERQTLSGVAVVRLTDAPAAWTGWRSPPAVTLIPARR